MATTRAPFLSTTYSAYYHSQVPKEDDELTHVGPARPPASTCAGSGSRSATPMSSATSPSASRFSARNWSPSATSAAASGWSRPTAPTAVRRWSSGLVSERGIRCCYHGWLFDVDGTILETPGEPAGSTFKDRLCHGAYPVHEYQGILFAYMGPPEDIPEFPVFDTFEREGYRVDALASGTTTRATGCRSWKTPWTRSTPLSCIP